MDLYFQILFYMRVWIRFLKLDAYRSIRWFFIILLIILFGGFYKWLLLSLKLSSNFVNICEK